MNAQERKTLIDQARTALEQADIRGGHHHLLNASLDELERFSAKWENARATLGSFNAEALKGISLATLIAHWNAVNVALDLTHEDEAADEREGITESEVRAVIESELADYYAEKAAEKGGKPIIRGRRLAVEHVLSLLDTGDSAESILAAYDWLEPEDIEVCMRWRAEGRIEKWTRLREDAQREYNRAMEDVRKTPAHGRLGNAWATPSGLDIYEVSRLRSEALTAYENRLQDAWREVYAETEASPIAQHAHVAIDQSREIKNTEALFSYTVEDELARLRAIIADDVIEMLDTGAAFVGSAGHESTAAAMYAKADELRAAMEAPDVDMSRD